MIRIKSVCCELLACEHLARAVLPAFALGLVMMRQVTRRDWLTSVGAATQVFYCASAPSAAFTGETTEIRSRRGHDLSAA